MSIERDEENRDKLTQEKEAAYIATLMWES